MNKNFDYNTFYQHKIDSYLNLNEITDAEFKKNMCDVMTFEHGSVYQKEKIYKTDYIENLKLKFFESKFPNVNVYDKNKKDMKCEVFVEKNKLNFVDKLFDGVEKSTGYKIMNRSDEIKFKIFVEGSFDITKTCCFYLEHHDIDNNREITKLNLNFDNDSEKNMKKIGEIKEIMKKTKTMLLYRVGRKELPNKTFCMIFIVHGIMFEFNNSLLKYDFIKKIFDAKKHYHNEAKKEIKKSENVVIESKFYDKQYSKLKLGNSNSKILSLLLNK